MNRVWSNRAIERLFFFYRDITDNFIKERGEKSI